MRSLLMHKSISSHVTTIHAQVKRLATILRDHERAVTAERLAVKEMRRCCDAAKSCLSNCVSNWDARQAAIKTDILPLLGDPAGAVQRDTERVKICGQIDILSNGTIKRSICDLFETINPGAAFDAARTVLRFSRDAA